jgi:hypothetical protein
MQSKISEFEDAKKLVGKNLPTIFNELDKGGPLRDALITMNEGNFDTIIKWANSAFDPKKTWFESCRELYHWRRGFGAEGAFFGKICDYVQPHWKSRTPPSIRVVLTGLWEQTVEKIHTAMVSEGLLDGSAHHLNSFLSMHLDSGGLLNIGDSGSVMNNKEILLKVGLKTPSTFSELFIEKTKLRDMDKSISLLFHAGFLDIFQEATRQVAEREYFPPGDPRFQPPQAPHERRKISTSYIEQNFNENILEIINNLEWKDVKGLF